MTRQTMLLGCLAGAATLTAPLGLTVHSPVAWASSVLTYEVTSADIATVDLEYIEHDGRKLLTGQSLPWRRDVALVDGLADKAQLRADWRPTAGPARWVTVTITQGDRLLCQSTLDVGNVTCYGNTPHVS